MCVAITLAPGTFLDKSEVVRMDRSNADGVGVAWAENGVVSWHKTTKVDPDYIMNMIYQFKDVPRLVHFRLATAGGARPELCHPFEIGPLANCDVTGTSTRVMIHNGHWGKWNEVKSILDRENLLPKAADGKDGPWSDSRLAAYLAHQDPDWLNALGGRVAVMLGTGETHRLGTWEELRPGLWVSNKNWENSTVTRGGYTGFRNWKGWGWDEGEYEAFLDEQRRAEEAELEGALAAAEKEMAAKLTAGTKETNEQKRTRKRAERAARRQSDAGEGDQPDSGGHHKDHSGRREGCKWHDSGYCYTHKTSLDHDVSSIPRTPSAASFQAANGLWYKAVERHGSIQVVETVPPGEMGTGGAC